MTIYRCKAVKSGAVIEVEAKTRHSAIRAVIDQAPEFEAARKKDPIYYNRTLDTLDFKPRYNVVIWPFDDVMREQHIGSIIIESEI